ncbi:hypothetical protein KUCAC02_023867, partial [Chaenocephalus aceratus]
GHCRGRIHRFQLLLLLQEETCLPEALRSDRYPQYFSGQTFANRIPCCAKEHNVFLRSKIQSITSSVRTE